MIKAKKCDCCDAILLYFKYNIISLTPCSQLTNPSNNCSYITPPSTNPYIDIGANYESNITYDLKSGLYKSVKFFNSSNYNYENFVADCNQCVYNI